MSNYDEYVKTFDEVVRFDFGIDAFDFLSGKLESEEIDLNTDIYLKLETEPSPVCFTFSVSEPENESCTIIFTGVETFDY